MSPTSSEPLPTSTVPDLLRQALGQDPSRPFLTFYDDATGERVELSLTTWANWVAKAAGLLADDLGLERGGSLLVDLPPHWLGTVLTAAAWCSGVAVTADRARSVQAAAVVTGPEGLRAYDAAARPLLVASLRPLGGGVTDPLPAGAVDLDREVLAQPDDFEAFDPPRPEDPAWAGRRTVLTQRDVVTSAPVRARVLTDLDPVSDPGVVLLAGMLRGGGSLALVRHPDPATWERRAAQERADEVCRVGDQPTRS